MALKLLIEAAFANVPYPGDDNITRCPYNCAECRRVADYFKGKTWTGHAAEELRALHIALSLFTPEAFQYFFLPAFMLVSLAAYEKGDLIPDAIRLHFEYARRRRASHFEVRMSQIFGAEQRHAHH